MFGAPCLISVLHSISRHIVEQIIACKYDFSGRRWKRVSKQAKAFVEDLLVEDPEERLTAEEAFGSTWLNRRFAVTCRGPTEDEWENTVSTLTSYAQYKKLKKLVCVSFASSAENDICLVTLLIRNYPFLDV